ncbi:MAG TPA: glycosyltransferase family A protein [Gemmatimonadaceae bacterium]|nr:glycosyltransferase family A protein [Gemmatimonadaceae bacterium]
MSTECPAVSVIVCTRNRCPALAQLLDSLSRLAIPHGLSWELVVVDNGCTDDTALLLDSFAHRLPVRRIFEGRKGLSRARNAGVAAARGAILAFTDDDCIPSPDWLSNIVREFEHDPELAGLGGRVELHDPRDFPITIRTSRTRETLASAHQLPSLMVGCNMAFRRWTLDAVGEFDVTLGAGTPAGSAEDTDYLYRALLLGLRIEYIPNVLVAHNHGRRHAEEVAQLKRSYARGRGAILTKYLLRADRGMACCAYYDLCWNGSELLRALRSRKLPRAVVARGWYMLAGAARWLESAHLPTPVTLDDSHHAGPHQLLSSPAESQ